MPDKAKDYQSLRAQLDEVLDSLNRNDLDVDEAIKAYEKGMAVVKDLEAYLKKAENKIKKVSA